MNMKKEYIKPEISTMEIDVMTMLAASSFTVKDIHADEELSNNRRGTWGDLWGEKR